METLLAIASWPLNVPVVCGSNTTWNVIDCPGFRVVGKVPPEREKPVPVTLAEFTVIAAVPVEETVTDCSTGVLTATLPKPIDVAFTLIAPPLVVVVVVEG